MVLTEAVAEAELILGVDLLVMGETVAEPVLVPEAEVRVLLQVLLVAMVVMAEQDTLIFMSYPLILPMLVCLEVKVAEAVAEAERVPPPGRWVVEVGAPQVFPPLKVAKVMVLVEMELLELVVVTVLALQLEELAVQAAQVATAEEPPVSL